FNFLYVILRGLYAFIVTDFIFCWAIALPLIFQHIKRQARTVVRTFFLELDNPYPVHLIGVAFFRFSGHLCQEVIAFLQISCSIFP
ncbi:hypothetical protein DQQ37_08270, partial [Escherichia coli]|nr:hypothetical protein [Escherichia coli]